MSPIANYTSITTRSHFIRFVDSLRYIFERASRYIQLDLRLIPVRISFQGVASAVLWESWNPNADREKEREREKENMCASHLREPTFRQI